MFEMSNSISHHRLSFAFSVNVTSYLIPHLRQGKARQIYLYSTFHTQWCFKVLYIKLSEIVIKNNNKNKELKKNNTNKII